MVIEKNGTNYSVCRIPGMVITEKKTLLAYYECRKDSLSDWAQIDLKIIRSEDGGQSWETVDIIPGSADTMNNPVMIVNNDKIHFLFCKNYKQVYYCVSRDDGRTFSEPKEISSVFENSGLLYTVVALGPGHGIVHNGRLLIPTWLAYNKDDPYAHWPSYISTLYSDDDGESWKVGEVIGKDTLVGPSECALENLPDGRLIISIRNAHDKRMRAIAFSENGSSGWSEPYLESALPDPVCQGSMCSKDGKIVHINCASSTKRENLTVKISGDLFKTYEEIEVDSLGGYADIAVDGNKIHVMYERDIFKDGLYFKTIELDE